MFFLCQWEKELLLSAPVTDSELSVQHTALMYSNFLYTRWKQAFVFENGKKRVDGLCLHTKIYLSSNRPGRGAFISIVVLNKCQKTIPLECLEVLLWLWFYPRPFWVDLQCTLKSKDINLCVGSLLLPIYSSPLYQQFVPYASIFIPDPK